MSAGEPVGALEHVSQRYGAAIALDDVSLTIPAGRIVGLIGPDGVGKSSLLALGGDLGDASERSRICPRIALVGGLFLALALRRFRAIAVQAG